MIVPDSSLLLYAYNKSSPYHAGAKSWWESRLSGAETIGLTYPVVFAFLRVGTSRQAFPEPYSLEEAESIIFEWMDLKITRLLNPSPAHTSNVISLLKRAGSSGGNLTTDAQIAAIAIDYKATVHTADRDFQRFRGINCYYPLDE